MDSLLANYLSIGDLIVVHMCGSSKTLKLRKNQEYLGLTITDNGNGRAFVKKITSADGSLEKGIGVGDNIATINSTSTLGMRHFEVAKAIRDIPSNTTFTLQLIEPLDVGSLNLKRECLNASVQDPMRGYFTERVVRGIDQSDACSTKDSSYDDLINSSLPFNKLLSKSVISIGSHDSSYRNSDKSYKIRIERINSVLDTFLGINDNLLAVQIYRAAVESEGVFQNFIKIIENSDLSIFNFNKETQTYLWESATD